MKYLYLTLSLIALGCVYHMKPKEQAAPAPAATHALNFEGVPMRASLEEVRRAESGFVPAQQSTDGHVQLLYGQGVKPFGLESTAAGGALYDGKLVEVYVKFAPASGAAMYQALVKSFGPPSIEITPGQCTEDYAGCAAAWYYGNDALTFNGPESRWAVVDTTMIGRVREAVSK